MSISEAEVAVIRAGAVAEANARIRELEQLVIDQQDRIQELEDMLYERHHAG